MIHALRRPSVLCVDRYPALLPTVEVLLNQLGYKALTASSVDEGLSHLSQNRVDAVILDYTLCGHEHHSGACIADRIHAAQPQAKIVVWCADDSVTKDNPSCADAILVKPVDPQKLASQLGSLLKY
jgi:DNA-binding response OmpR family regulator